MLCIVGTRAPKKQQKKKRGTKKKLLPLLLGVGSGQGASGECPHGTDYWHSPILLFVYFSLTLRCVVIHFRS